MKLNKAIDKYLLDTQVRTSEANHNYEKSKCRMLNDFMGSKGLRSINRDVINQYIVSRRQQNPKLSNTTINKEVATLNRVLKYSSCLEIPFKKLKEKKPLTPTIPQDTKALVFTYLESRKFRSSGFRNLLLFKLLEDTGLRLNEVRNLRLHNLDLESNSFTVTTTKANRDRLVYFTNSTRKLLEEYISKFAIDDYILIDFNKRLPISTTSVETVARRLRAKLNLPKSISPHKWRHTFANDFNQKVNDIESLRILLGHSNILTTQRYLHHDNNHIKSQYDKAQRQLDRA
ncbi:tyrosine-type recombinase/integrase [Mycoplasmatota bacterium zrk1]